MMNMTGMYIGKNVNINFASISLDSYDVRNEMIGRYISHLTEKNQRYRNYIEINFSYIYISELAKYATLSLCSGSAIKACVISK